MQKLEFAEAIDLIVERTPRYDREAYYFLRDALDFTVKARKKARDASGSGHVSGQQLLEGVRQYAIKQYGPMVVTVLEYWGIRSTRDIGAIVFARVECGVLVKQDNDALDE